MLRFVRCLICWGKGFVSAYRGPDRKLRCIHCDGTGYRDRRVS